MASRNVRNSQRKRKSDTPANDGCSDKETNIEDIQSEMDEGEDPGTSEELSLHSISKRIEELFHKIDQLDIRNQIEELKVDINGRDTKMTEDISMLTRKVLTQQTEINNLEERLQVLEKERRRNHIIITGLKEEKDVHVREQINDLFQDMGVGFDSKDVEACYRIGQKQVVRPRQNAQRLQPQLGW